LVHKTREPEDAAEKSHDQKQVAFLNAREIRILREEKSRDRWRNDDQEKSRNDKKRKRENRSGGDEIGIRFVFRAPLGNIILRAEAGAEIEQKKPTGQSRENREDAVLFGAERLKKNPDCCER